MAKIITSDGIPEFLFWKVAEQTERKSIGLLKAVLTTIKDNFGEQFAPTAQMLIRAKEVGFGNYYKT